jgi:HPt (histidine-containing phosphotransfer) domain-containing protein
MESPLTGLTSEYEELLRRLIDQREAQLNELSSKRGSNQKLQILKSEINFLKGELQRYQQALAIFRTKGVPKVGRWGRPEVEGTPEHNE